MKKVSILTFCNNMIEVNYGQVLQCYALQKACEKLDCKVEVVRYRKKRKDELFKNGLKIGKLNEVYENYYQKKFLEHNSKDKIDTFQRFMNKNVNLTYPCYNIKDVETLTSDSNILICGSDQIWNPIWTDDAYMLNFGNKNQKRIAYAASGIIKENKFSSPIYRRLGENLNEFDYISVREKSGIEVLKKYTKNKIVDVLDPVFLLSKEEWNQVSKKLENSEPYILCYTIRGIRQYKMILRELARYYNVKKIICIEAHCIPSKSSEEFNIISNPGPQDLLGLINNAVAVCTDSFHGTSLSIIYGKQFCLFSSKNAGEFFCSDRIKDLLEKLHIQNRNCDCLKDIKRLATIDYINVNKYLSIEIEKSYGFLKNALE